jgi:glycosyltransferase involved in cell wall biosynthesis
MTTSIVILVPVLNRPHRVRPLIENIRENTQVPYRLLFIATENQRDELEALDAADADYIVRMKPAGPGDYAAKTNEGYRKTTEPFVFTGADDLNFHHEWDVAALDKMADESIGVVGTNDLGNPRTLKGIHATHSLVRRTYARELGTIDRLDAILCERYHHLYVDDELVATAKARNAWAFAEDSHVEHFHPHLYDSKGKPKGKIDSTYLQGFKRVRQDRALFAQRRRLWA